MLTIPLEPVETLRRAEVPKPTDIVRFRPTGVDLNPPDIQWFKRWACTARFFEMLPPERRYLIGRVKYIKRVGNEFYYRIVSGQIAYDVAYRDVIGKGDDYP